MNIAITVGGIQYQASPLRLKHLRQINDMLEKGISPPKSVFEDLNPWMPFVVDCIKINHPEFTADMLDDMTAQEFYDAWMAIASNSGVKLTGEAAPIQQTGQQSTVTSAVASA